MDPINHATAEAVRDAIHDARLTQKFVANGARIPHTNWQRRMRGDVCFDIAQLSRISRLLNRSLSSLANDISERVERDTDRVAS